jgi:anti-sigma-K factor RskA
VEHRELQDLIPAHALHALDPDDASLLEEHLATCEACRAELDALIETTALLAFATDPAEPPASLRASILGAVAPAAAETARPRVRLAFLRGAFSGALATAAVALAVALIVGVGSGSNPPTQVKVLTGASGAIVRDGTQSKLLVSDLKRPAAGKTYEAWLIGTNGKPLPAGLFKGGGTIVIDLHGNANDATTVAITVEPDGGSPTPTTKPFASATLA